MIRALPHLLACLCRALYLHYLGSRRAQLQQSIDTLVDCVAHDQLLIADMRRNLAVIDSRAAAASAANPLPRSPR